MKPFHNISPFLASLLCFTLLLGVTVSTNAQSFCNLPNAPITNALTSTWAQNATVSVNVNSNTYSQTEYTGCIKPIFDNFN